jgi:hypothetical protein
MTGRKLRNTGMIVLLLAAATGVIAQQGGLQAFDLFGGSGSGQDLHCTVDNTVLLVSGTTDNAAVYFIQSVEDLEFSGASRLIIKLSGIGADDIFDMGKLLKLELNDTPQRTITPGMRNRNDPDYINARNGEAVFDISAMRNIRKINLVFFNCTVANVRIEVLYE